MKTPRLRKSFVVIAFLSTPVFAHGCGHPAASETVNVSMKNIETYQYSTVGGDEEGARISTQASHARISEIRRNAETSGMAVYFYQPVAGFVGADHAEIEIVSSSDGVSAPTSIKNVIFHFVIHN